VNALEHIVIPKFITIVAYINQELDELAREDFYRLKKVLDNKKKVIEQQQLENDLKSEELKQLGIVLQPAESMIGNLQLDQDVIF